MTEMEALAAKLDDLLMLAPPEAPISTVQNVIGVMVTLAIHHKQRRVAAPPDLGQAGAPPIGILWECKDDADGWIPFTSPDEAKRYQAETGCLLRVTYRAPPAATSALHLGAEGLIEMSHIAKEDRS